MDKIMVTETLSGFIGGTIKEWKAKIYELEERFGEDAELYAEDHFYTEYGESYHEAILELEYERERTPEELADMEHNERSSLLLQDLMEQLPTIITGGTYDLRGRIIAGTKNGIWNDVINSKVRDIFRKHGLEEELDE